MINNDNVKCSKHQECEIGFYCKDCQSPMCINCFDSHSRHLIIKYNKINIFKESLKVLEKESYFLNLNKKEIEINYNNSKKECEKINESITHLFKILHKILQVEENNLIRQVKSIKLDNKKSFNTIKTKIETKIENINGLINIGKFKDQEILDKNQEINSYIQNINEINKEIIPFNFNTIPLKYINLDKIDKGIILKNENIDLNIKDNLRNQIIIESYEKIEYFPIDDYKWMRNKLEINEIDDYSIIDKETSSLIINTNFPFPSISDCSGVEAIVFNNYNQEIRTDSLPKECTLLSFCNFDSKIENGSLINIKNLVFGEECKFNNIFNENEFGSIETLSFLNQYSQPINIGMFGNNQNDLITIYLPLNYNMDNLDESIKKSNKYKIVNENNFYDLYLDNKQKNKQINNYFKKSLEKILEK